MYGLLLEYLQQFLVVLYDDMVSVNISVDIFKSEAYGESLLILTYLVSVSVRVLFAKAIGVLFCSRACQGHTHLYLSV